jgi:hypothetical protein
MRWRFSTIRLEHCTQPLEAMADHVASYALSLVKAGGSDHDGCDGIDDTQRLGREQGLDPTEQSGGPGSGIDRWSQQIVASAGADYCGESAWLDEPWRASQPPRPLRLPTTHIVIRPREVWSWDVMFVPTQIQGPSFSLQLT